jgi:glycosyltransferase involved in cell wall biosynthesis
MSLHPPFFTVIVPVHNKELYVSRSIQSIIDQSYKHFEIIVIDDASTDNSLEAIKNFEDERIRVFKRPVPGAAGYAARNLGIQKAKAEWVTFLDADDEWTPDHLENFAEFLTLCSGELDFLGSGYKTDYGEEMSHPKDAVFDKKSALKSFYRHKSFCTNTVCVRKKVITAAGGFPAKDCKRGGDLDTWLRCLLHSQNVALLSNVTALYNTAASGVVSQKHVLLDHPIAKTVATYIRENNPDKDEEKILKKISNRKVIQWAIENRRNKKFSLSQLEGLYIGAMTAREFKMLFRLF